VKTSLFDLFKVGIGPSSSHTVGPMRAAGRFVAALDRDGLLPRTTRVTSELFGSLGAIGHGHGSYNAVLWGLEGEKPETVDTTKGPLRADEIRRTGQLRLNGTHSVTFDAEDDLILYRRRSLPFHPNGMVFTAYDEGKVVSERTYYSIGGGFVLDDDDSGHPQLLPDPTPVPYPFRTGTELLGFCRDGGLSVSQVMLANECVRRPEAEVRAGLLRIWSVMAECIHTGCSTPGVLPGGLKVRRRAADLYQRLIRNTAGNASDPLAAMDWVTLWALAVNEENASGGRVVTAPTNGAAGIIPAVLHYAVRFVPGTDDESIVNFLLVAGALGAIYQQTASISGAEVGCQGEVGTACSMAAGALAEVLGGTPEQVENAARSAWNTIWDSPAIRSGPRPDPLYRTKCRRVGEGDYRRTARASWRRPPHREPRQGDQDHDADRRGYEDQIQGDGSRRPSRQHRGVLVAAPRNSPAEQSGHDRRFSHCPERACCASVLTARGPVPEL
jgi:L-serine dehydratase